MFAFVWGTAALYQEGKHGPAAFFGLCAIVLTVLLVCWWVRRVGNSN